MNSSDRKFSLATKQAVDLAAVVHAVERYLSCTEAEAEADSLIVADEEMSLIRTYKNSITFDRHMLQDILQYIKSDKENEKSRASSQGFQIGDHVCAIRDSDMQDGNYLYLVGDEGIVIAVSDDDIQVEFRHNCREWCCSKDFHRIP